MPNGSLRTFVLITLAVLALSQPSLSDIGMMYVDLGSGTPDASFDGTTLTIETALPPEEDGVIIYEGGEFYYYHDVTFSLQTTYFAWSETESLTFGRFAGGSFTLTFSDGATAFYFSGAIARTFAWVDDYGRVQVDCYFDPVTTLLPADLQSDWWPTVCWHHDDLDGISIEVPGGLTDYDWSQPAPWLGATTGWANLFPVSCSTECGCWRPGDANVNWHYDEEDYAELASCIVGPGAVNSALCLYTYDFNCDGNIDLADFAAFQRGYHCAHLCGCP